jgi:hypothetical protein
MMRRIKTVQCLSRIVAIAVLVGAPVARADVTLWYNGDLDQRDALVNQTGPADGIVYDNFIVPVGQSYTITGAFSNNAMYIDPTGSTLTAYWEIRSGVSAGNGGTLLASGDGTDTTTNTGLSFNFGGQSIPVYKNEVDGLSVTLGAGTYWLAVAPDVHSQDSYIVTTSGANAIGSPPGNDGNSFFSSTFFSQSFVPTSDPSLEGPGTWDYSMGIIGTSTTITIPEPSTMIVGLAGLTFGAACAWKRRSTRS